jgi:hypothetical protein
VHSSSTQGRPSRPCRYALDRFAFHKDIGRSREREMLTVEDANVLKKRGPSVDGSRKRCQTWGF